uniref:Uncharacterized protein n=1 Tax=Wuchereria bancrofti TaxID=6293 RepID=A0A1I8EFF4_WUCBA
MFAGFKRPEKRLIHFLAHASLSRQTYNKEKRYFSAAAGGKNLGGYYRKLEVVIMHAVGFRYDGVCVYMYICIGMTSLNISIRISGVAVSPGVLRD